MKKFIFDNTRISTCSHYVEHNSLPLSYRANPLAILWLELFLYFSNLQVRPCKRYEQWAAHQVVDVPLQISDGVTALLYCPIKTYDYYRLFRHLNTNDLFMDVNPKTKKVCVFDRTTLIKKVLSDILLNGSEAFDNVDIDNLEIRVRDDDENYFIRINVHDGVFCSCGHYASWEYCGNCDTKRPDAWYEYFEEIEYIPKELLI